MPSFVNRPGRSGVWPLIVVVLTLALWLVPVGMAFAEEGDAVASKGAPNIFMHIIYSAGVIFGPILLLLSVALVAICVMLLMDLRLTVAIPPLLVEQFTDTVNKRKFKEAYDLARADKSFIGKVLTDGMARLQYGIEDAREASLNRVDSLKTSKEQLNNYVAVISSLGPLIGLVGTVYGMIKSFMVLGQGGKVDPAALADGISHALVITMLGIGLAVPGVFFNVFFKNRINRIAMDVANLSDDLLTQMYHNSKKPGGPSTSVTTSTTTAADSRTATPAKASG